jgi:serine/threonine protein kinase
MSEDIPELKEYNIPEIKGYDIVSYIGRGVWTTVFKAKKKTDGSEWALKFYRPTELGQQYVENGSVTEETLWQKECQNGKTPVHQNIAFNSLEEADNGESFLAEVYLGDRFLHQYLDQVGTPSLEETLHISGGIADALEVQHTKAGGKGRAHGDVAPKNLAYPLDKIVKLSDFGTSTIGDNHVGNRGYPFIRALEQFSATKEPTKEGDVFSFGSILYRMLTGKYAFEDELERFGDSAEKHLSYLAENPEIWNATIDQKVKNIRIPKQFRNLLKRCLHAPDEIKREGFLGRILPAKKGRIKDGAELKKALEKTIRKYEASRTRWKKYATAAAALLALGIGAGIGADKINEKIGERDRQIKLQRKIRTVKLHKDRAPSLHNDAFEAMEYGELAGWYFALKKDGIEDPMIQYSAYLNPELTYEAIKAVGPEFNDDFWRFIQERDIELWAALWEIKGGGTDNMTRLVSADRADKVHERWAQIKKDYQRRKEEEAEKKRLNDLGLGPGGPGLGYQPDLDRKPSDEVKANIGAGWDGKNQ